MFGERLHASAAGRAASGKWVGPIASDYGQHLVRLDPRVEATGLPFAEVRDEVREEWLAARIAARRDRHYRDLRARYSVTVERPPGAEPRRGEGALSRLAAGLALVACSAGADLCQCPCHFGPAISSFSETEPGVYRVLWSMPGFDPGSARGAARLSRRLQGARRSSGTAQRLSLRCGPGPSAAPTALPAR